MDIDEVRQKETTNDHLLINALMTLTKILQECSVLEGKAKAKMTTEAWGENYILNLSLQLIGMLNSISQAPFGLDNLRVIFHKVWHLENIYIVSLRYYHKFLQNKAS